jgi:RND family efflux transporter MFP subunit
MYMNRYKMFMKLLAGSFVLLYLPGCSSPEKPIQTEPPVAVTIARPVSMGTSAITVSGQIEAAQTAVISTRIMGYITKMNVKAGDQVRRGQLLFTVSNEDLQAKRAQADAQIAQAEAQFQNAKKDYDRFTALYKQQSATEKEVENFQLQYEAAKAGAEAARQLRNEVNASFSYTNVVAPFDGIISAKNADAGSIANPGMPVLTLQASKGFRVAAGIPETQIADISIGANAIITLKSIERVFTGTISEINPSSAVSGGQYPIKINIPADQYKGLYAGMYANVSIKTKNNRSGQETSDRILIPVSAVVRKDQLTGIYTKGENNKAVLRWIRLGEQYGNEVEVLSGLGKEESFIVNADGRLFNGASVVVN